MATLINNTVQSYDANAKRQSIDNLIYMLAQVETPVLTMATGDVTTGRKKSGDRRVKGPTHEWQTDVLEVGNADATLFEGRTYDFGAQTQPVTVKNHTQINGRPIIVSDSTQATELVGRKDEMARLKMRNYKSIKRDMEARILGNSASVKSAAGVKGVAGSLHSFLETHTSRGTGGADGGYNAGTGNTVAATDAAPGDRRAFTEGLLTALLAQMARSGASPDVVALPPLLKLKANGFVGIAPMRQQVSGNYGKVIGSVEVYTNPITSKPLSYVTTYNARAAETEAFILSNATLDVGYLQAMQEKAVAKDGEAEKVAIICEWTLIVKNEGECGVIADLNPAA